MSECKSPEHERLSKIEMKMQRKETLLRERNRYGLCSLCFRYHVYEYVAEHGKDFDVWLTKKLKVEKA